MTTGTGRSKYRNLTLFHVVWSVPAKVFFLTANVFNNAPCLPPPPKKKNFAIVYDFSWDDCNTQETGNSGFAQLFFLGRDKVHYSLYESRKVQDLIL